MAARPRRAKSMRCVAARTKCSEKQSIQSLRRAMRGKVS